MTKVFKCYYCYLKATVEKLSIKDCKAKNPYDHRLIFKES